MTIFEYVTVAISIVLGLGVAQLLSGALEVVRARRHTRLHWIPITWALSIFWIQLEFWWSLFGLSEDADVWTHGNFLLAIATSLCLFAAGSLILPRRWPQGGGDLMAYFDADGWTGVAAFALFNLCALPLNSRLFGAPVISWVSLYLVGMLAVQFGTILRRSRRLTAVCTAVFLLLQVGVLTLTVVPQFTD